MQPRRDSGGHFHRGQINHRNGAGDGGSHYWVSDNFRTGGVDLEVFRQSGAPTLVADIGGCARAVDQDAVRRVAHANLRTLYWWLRGQLNLGEGVVLVEQGVGAAPILRDGHAARIRGPRTI